MSEEGFAVSAVARWGCWGACAASPGTADITTAVQLTITAVTIFFIFMIDSFRGYDSTTKFDVESNVIAVSNCTTVELICGLPADAGLPKHRHHRTPLRERRLEQVESHKQREPQEVRVDVNAE